MRTINSILGEKFDFVSIDSGHVCDCCRINSELREILFGWIRIVVMLPHFADFVPLMHDVDLWKSSFNRQIVTVYSLIFVVIFLPLSHAVENM